MADLRRKTTQFPSPFFPEELELDPEKALWVPGKKKIFVPTGIVKPDLWTCFNWDDIINAHIQETRLHLQQIRYAYESVCECVPSRSGFLTSDRSFRVPVTYNDIQRSEVPQFRAGRRSGRNDWT